eukprot:TRINITY_DN2685_c0_g1_i1.p1 TRINITY_DN2685_c0_g1~~TRINITY_DN2685_c0_g1_i1.p1  ORF type:complete len:208 (+),score=26.30 TRINITY_DN2685_c0_g1_i1:147-770(+)
MMPVGNILDTSHGDSVIRGSAIAAVTGLCLLPIEPVTGVTLLTSGLGVAGAKIKSSMQLSDLKVSEAQSKLETAHEQLEQLQFDKDMASDRTAELEAQNARLKYALIAAGCISAAVFAYKMYSKQSPKSVTVGGKSVSVFHGPPSTYHPHIAADGDSLCKICMENTTDTLLLPCRHAQTCWECTMKLSEPICPLCRKELTQLEYVYM